MFSQALLAVVSFVTLENIYRNIFVCFRDKLIISNLYFNYLNSYPTHVTNILVYLLNGSVFTN